MKAWIGMMLWMTVLCNVNARTWTSTCGSELEAEYVRQTPGTVTLRTPDGRQTTVSRSRLSAEDEAHLRELAEQERPAVRQLGGTGPDTPRARPVRADDLFAGNPDVVAQLEPGEILTRTAAGGTGITYFVYTPADFNPEAAPPPIIVAFSPVGNGHSMIEAIKPAADRMGWMLVGCNQLRNGMTDEPLARRMENEVLDDIFANIPHNRRRIYFAGFSGGASRSYHLTARRPEPVAGILAYGGWMGGEPYHKLPYRHGMAVAMINGDSDGPANGWVDRDTRLLRRRRCVVKTFSFRGGHELPGATTTASALQWLEEDWNARGVTIPAPGE